MSAATRYVLDTNVLIKAARRYYAFDIAPSFWAALVDLASDGRVVSIDRVKGEIDRGKDDLADWANGSFHDALPRPVIRRCLTRIAT